MKKSNISLQRNIKREELIEVCKILHPELKEELIEKGLKWHSQYSWVCVEFRSKGYGYVHFAINYHNTDGSVWGPITPERAKEIVKEKVNLNIWRICNDHLFKKDEENDKTRYKKAKEYVEKFHTKPSAKEFYDYYMRD